MDEKIERSLELAEQMPDMTYPEWKLLSRLIDNRFEKIFEIRKKEAENTSHLSDYVVDEEC